MGFHALQSENAQRSLHWGAQPTPLQRLCALPFQYFSDAKCKDVLFPTLIAICYRHSSNTCVVEEEVSTKLLAEYIQGKQQQRSAEEKENTLTVDDQENNPTKPTEEEAWAAFDQLSLIHI